MVQTLTYPLCTATSDLAMFASSLEKWEWYFVRTHTATATNDQCNEPAQHVDGIDKTDFPSLKNYGHYVRMHTA